MTGPCIRMTAAVAAAVVVLGLAGCDDGGSSDGALFAIQTAEAVSEGPDLSSLLLEVDEIPLPGWVSEPTGDGDGDGDPTVDSTTGGVCVFDFTDVMTPTVRATERGVMFANEAQATLFQEYIWAAPTANDLVATITSQLAACAGPHEGASGDTTVSMVSEPTDLTMPGAASSVCRLHSVVVNGAGPFQGVMCIGATGERVLMIMMMSPDPSVATPQQDYVTMMTAATMKAFTG